MWIDQMKFDSGMDLVQVQVFRVTIIITNMPNGVKIVIGINASDGTGVYAAMESL